ncbi:hypothetical protein ACFVAJ_18685 [Agromyces sp. NPDC057679]|uniref:hypothetical protein n=1 Tax=Agromyces sp. NPDC057679 TaxID=3346207 RepID=UPI00366D7960
MTDRQSDYILTNDVPAFLAANEVTVAAPRRGKLFRAFAVTAVIVLAATIGGTTIAESAQAGEFAARELAIQENAGRVGIGSVDADIPAFRATAAAALARSAADTAKVILDDASDELPADQLATLTDARTKLLEAADQGASADALTSQTAAIEAEGSNVSTLLTAARKAAAEEAARIAAEQAAAEEAARIAAEEAASWEDDSDDWSDESPSGPAAESPAPAPAAPSYPGLGPRPTDEECGPCRGREMFPLFHDGKWRWACNR